MAAMLAYKRDVGAGNSDLTYQALAGVAYGFRWGNLSLTYRYLFYDEGDEHDSRQTRRYAAIRRPRHNTQ